MKIKKGKIVNVFNLHRKIIILCLILTTSAIYNQKSNNRYIVNLEQSAQDWQENLSSLKKYAQAVQIYFDHNAPNLDEMYKELGVSPNSSKEDIKKAYRKIALTLHPDKWSGIQDSSEKELAVEKFKKVTVAYTDLTNTELRNAYELINQEPNRLDLSTTNISEIIDTLEKATGLVSIIQQYLKLIENNSIKEQDLKNLNQQLKEQYISLKNISKNDINIDGNNFKEEIRTWAKSMQSHIEYFTLQIKEQSPKESMPLARTDKAYKNWLLQHPSNITMQAHENGRTPLAEAIEAGSPEMAQNIIEAAQFHGISIDTILQPIKEEYSIDILQGKKSEAQAVLDKVYALNIKQLSNKMTFVAQKIHRLHNNSQKNKL